MTTLRERVLIEAAVMAASFLELGPADLAVVDRCVPDAVVALALVTVEHDAAFGPRWRDAGDDWVERGTVLRDALIWVLTPDPGAAARAVQ